MIYVIETNGDTIREIMQRLACNGYKWSAGQQLDNFATSGQGAYSYMLLHGGGYHGCNLRISTTSKSVTLSGIESVNLDLTEFRKIFKLRGEEGIVMENGEIIFKCSDCGDESTQRNDFMVGLDGELYCEGCFYDKYTICDNCGTTIERDYEFYSERTDRVLCEECYNEEYSGEINGYHDTSYCELQYLGNGDENALRFGMEIEVNNDCASWKKLSRCAGEVRDILGSLCFDIQEDGSIPNGFEIITNPMTIEYYNEHGYNKLKEMCDCLKENGFETYGENCGVHIHITRKPLIDSDNCAVDTMHYLMETFKKDIQHYANRDSSDYAMFLSDSYRVQMDDEKPKLSEVKKAVKQLKGERYLVVNSNPSNTIELRCFASSIDINDLNNYLTIAFNLALTVIEKHWTYKTFSQLFGLDSISKARTFSKKQINADLQEIVRLKLRAIELKNNLITLVNSRIDTYYEYINDKLKEKRKINISMDKEFMEDYNNLCQMLHDVNRNYSASMRNLSVTTYDWIDSYQYRVANKELETLVEEYNKNRDWL